MANEKTIKVVKLLDLKKAGWNPPKRMKGLDNLAKSIEEIGLQYPILVTTKLEVVDGHRRLKCCEELGWEEIPVILTNTDRLRAYADVNGTAKRFSGHDVLHIFLHQPSALTPIQVGRCTTAVERLGLPLVKKLYKGGYSLKLYQFARRLATYCDQDNNKFLVSAVKWLMEYGVFNVHSALHMKIPPRVIVKAIKTNTPLVTQFVEPE